MYTYLVSWAGGLVSDVDNSTLQVGDRITIVSQAFTSNGYFEVTADGLDTNATYRLLRRPNLSGFSGTVASNFAPAGTTGTLTDTNPPPTQAFYRIEGE